MSLHSVPIAEQLNWLVVSREKSVNNLFGLPPVFEAYLKILPPLGIDHNIPIANYSFAKRTVNDLNVRAAFWNQYGIVNGQPNPNQLESISYRAVANTLGLKYDAEFDSSAIGGFYGEWPPHLGSSIAQYEAFVQQLVQTIGPDLDAYFYGAVDEGNYDWGKNEFPTDWLELGKVAHLSEVYRRDGQLPSYTFAINYAWCLYQAESTDSLIIGCTTSKAQELLTNSMLEVMLLSPL